VRERGGEGRESSKNDRLTTFVSLCVCVRVRVRVCVADSARRGGESTKNDILTLCVYNNWFIEALTLA